MTKAFRIARTGGPEVMQWVDVDLPDPGRGQVRMRHTAVAVNFRDVLVRKGVHTVPLPSGLGIESAGTIEALGSDVSGLAVGERVVCVSGPDGACAAARNVSATRVIPLPEAIDDRIAAAMMVRGMTARYLLKKAYAVQPGDTILVHAAAGGVGLILCQWAKHLGAAVIGTVSSEEKADIARAHGCDHPIVYTREDFAARVSEITGGEGVPVVYDSVGKATFEGSLRCLRRRGTMVSFGEASGEPDPIEPHRLGYLGSVFLTHPSLNHYTATRAELLETANDLFEMVASGRIRIAIGRTYALRDAPQAHADLEARRTTGSVVLVP